MADDRPRNSPLPTADATFASLGLPTVLVTALAEQGITDPFPIQTATLPDSLSGRDVLGRGRTGSGKTYAFVLPLLARLSGTPAKRRAGRPRALILAPTRELVTQIDAAITPLAKTVGLRTITVFGGVRPGGQISALRNGTDIVIACPGRLEDHVRSGHANLDSIEVTVLDEADHMADLGFLPGVRRLMDATPRNGQRLLFSATLDRGVDVLVKRYLTNPVTHSVDSAQSPVANMTHHVLHVSKESRVGVLVDLAAAPGRTLVFTRTKHGANRVTEQLSRMQVGAQAIHGNKSQGARQAALESFRSGRTRVLVATDIAARGIDVDGITHVVNFELPNEPESYVHRIGRTARAGARGVALSFCDREERGYLRDIERLTKTPLRVVEDHPFRSAGGINREPDASTSGSSDRPRPAARRTFRGGSAGSSYGRQRRG
jgi:superfamily II DNA/RNA helicase